jgi:hypothetical protein
VVVGIHRLLHTGLVNLHPIHHYVLVVLLHGPASGTIPLQIHVPRNIHSNALQNLISRIVQCTWVVEFILQYLVDSTTVLKINLHPQIIYEIRMPKLNIIKSFH